MSSYTSGRPNEELVASKLFDVTGFKAVVTGGGTGIGLMITQALVANGATVYITGRRKEVLESVVEKYSGKGGENAGKIIAVQGDITSKDDLKRIASEVGSQEPNGIHLLVANAGVAKEKSTTSFSSNGSPDFKSPDSIAEHLWQSDFSHFQETFETNITAQFFTAAAFIPLLGKGRGSTPGYSPSIINVTSISGIMKGSSGGQFAYSASKAGFIQLTKNLATLLTESKIRVNTIAPGIYPSEMTADSSDETQKSELKDVGKGLPAGRTGDDRDMAAAVLYLAGPGGVFLNGQIVHPDGGALLTQPSSL